MKGKLLLLLHLILLPVFCQAGPGPKFFLGLYASKEAASYKEFYRLPTYFQTAGYSLGGRATLGFLKTDFIVGVLYTQVDIGEVHYGYDTSAVLPTVDVKSNNLEIQAILRHRFFKVAKICPFYAVGYTQYIRNPDLSFGDIDPNSIREKDKLNVPAYNPAIYASAGLMLKMSRKVYLDLEPNIKAFVLKNPNYIDHLAFGFGLKLDYKLLGE